MSRDLLTIEVMSDEKVNPRLTAASLNPWQEGSLPVELVQRAAELEAHFMAEPEKPGKRHHYVPEFYLENWTVEGDRRILALQRSSGIIKSLSVRDAAVSTGFYTSQLVDGRVSTAAERLLSFVEDRSAPALRRLQPGVEVDPADRSTLALFLAFQVLRGRGNREDFDKTVELVKKKELLGGINPGDRVAAARLLKEHKVEPSESEINLILSWVDDPDSIRLRLPVENHVRAMLETVMEIAPYFWAREWVVVESDHARFTTTDEPVVVVRPVSRLQLGGLALADEVLYPVSPARLLSLPITPRRPPTVDAEYVRLVNNHVSFFAFDWVFATQEDREQLVGLKNHLVGKKRPERRVEETPLQDGSSLLRIWSQ